MKDIQRLTSPTQFLYPHADQSSPRKRNVYKLKLASSKHLRSLLIILTTLTAAIPMIPFAHAQASTLYISPASQGLSPKGSTVTYDVAVSNFDQFNAYDVSVQSDPSVLDPQ